jgi:hypothetical protein
MGRLKSQALVKSLRIEAGMMREQLDQFAAPRPRLCDGPLHHFLSDATASAMRGDANVLDQAARSALRAQSPQDAELKAPDDGTVMILCDHKLDMRMVVNRLERLEIARRQWLLDPFAAAAERIVRQHPHDGRHVFASGTADGDRGSRRHDDPDKNI